MAVEDGFTIRRAEPEDAEPLWRLVRELAIYERLEGALRSGPTELVQGMFCGCCAVEAQLAVARRGSSADAGEGGGAGWPGANEVAVGCAIYYPCFSTFLGRTGLYLEDLFVCQSHRGRGLGWALWRAYARRAVELGAGYLEWRALDWNEPATRFYLGLGAAIEPDWRVFRLQGAALERLVTGEAGPG